MTVHQTRNVDEVLQLISVFTTLKLSAYVIILRSSDHFVVSDVSQGDLLYWKLRYEQQVRVGRLADILQGAYQRNQLADSDLKINYCA